VSNEIRTNCFESLRAPRHRSRQRRVLVIAAALIVTACGNARDTPLPRGSVVLVVGDSITAGYGIDSSEAWPARLAGETGWRVVAAGVNGDVTAGGRERLPSLLDEHVPALVVIELGGNDLLRHIPEAQIVANLDAMIDTARAHGARVALMAVPQPTAIGALTGLSPAGFYRDLAQRRQVVLIDRALPAVLSEDNLKQDAIHPNAAGHAALARRTADELKRAGVVPAG
jgi:acyl-CoA thioesterase-1